MSNSEKTSGASPSDSAGGAALRTYFRIAEQWGLDLSQQRCLLGNPPAALFRRWRLGRGVPTLDALERVSYVLGIFAALNTLLPDPNRADSWIKRPNSAPPFGGRSALDRMMSGDIADLQVVRRYLDGVLIGTDETR